MNVNNNIYPHPIIDTILCWGFYISSILLGDMESIGGIIFVILQNLALIGSLTVSIITVYRFFKDYKEKKKRKKSP